LNDLSIEFPGVNGKNGTKRSSRVGTGLDDDDLVGRSGIQDKPARGEDLEPATVTIP
jgi:hypothetical protein